MFKIYLSSAAGLDYTGVDCTTEEKAKALCDKYNEQDKNSYAHHVYCKH